MLRALLFAGTGVAWFAFWFLMGSDTSVQSIQTWPNVLSFSAVLLVLGVALWTFGRMIGGRWVTRLATIAAATAGLMSVTNIVEDGFRVEPAFYLFVLGLLTLDITLAGLALAIARTVAGRRKLLAAVPAAALAAILLAPIAGGPLMLGAWLAAAAVALRDGAPQPQSELAA